MLQRIIDKLGRLLEKVHYHEYPVEDENGNIIGHEVITTRGSKVILFPTRNSKKDEVSQGYSNDVDS